MKSYQEKMNPKMDENEPKNENDPELVNQPP